MSPDVLLDAAALLACRRDASAAEVRAAYRAVVRRARPDLGAVDGTWLTTVQAARDLLLASATPDRRRRPRVAGSSGRQAAGLRRSTWAPPAEPAAPRLDLRL